MQACRPNSAPPSIALARFTAVGELLGLSRQYVDRLISEGVLPARHVPGSTHRKVRVADVVALGERRDHRRKVISKMVETVTEAGAQY